MKKALLTISVLSILVLSGCSSTNTDTHREDDGEEITIGNPYSEGSGHYAGYEWAERTGDPCSGNSNSFIEGCEEYYRQMENS